MRGLPERWREAGPAVAVAALAVVSQLLIHDRSAVPVDEGQLAAIADRILHGEVLYRDIYTGIFPGIYYATALLFAVFGEDVVVTRWAQLAVNTVTALCLWWLGRRAARPLWAALAPVLYLGLVVLDFPGLTMFNYSPLALAGALLSLLFLLRYLESGRWAEGLAVGLCLGACGLVKQNFGALGVAAAVLGLLWGRRDGPLSERPIPAVLWPVLAGGALLGVAGLVAFTAAGALPSLLDATLLSIGQSQMGAFNDPLPPIFGPHPENDPRFVFVYTPAALFNYAVRGEALFGLPVSPLLRSLSIRLAYGSTLAVLAGGVLLLWLDRAAEPPRRRTTRALVVFSLLFFLGIFPSAIWSHLAFVLAPILVLVAALADRLAARLEAAVGWGRAVARACWCGVVLATLALSLRISLDLARWYPQPLGLARASLRVDPDQARHLQGGTQFLQRCARPVEPVFVAPDMPLLYFLADRRNPTPFDLVIPGDVSGPLIVERLEATQTRCVVYNPRMYLQFAPLPELFPELAGYLEASYERAVEIPGQGDAWYGLIRRRPPAH